METGVYQFGPYRQDASSRILTRDGSPVAIAPKTFDTLLYLVAHAGRTVSREELIRAVWPDTFVEEGNLNYSISQIRKILGELAPGVPYIQTLPKRGYRFVAAVSCGGDTLPGVHPISHPAAPAPPQWLRTIRPARVVIPLATATLAAWFVLKHGAPGSTPMHAPVRLTSDSGLTMTPAISSDGKLIAYASDRSGEGSLDIWVQQAGGKPIRLTHHPADDYDPSFSPDGLTIVFRSERDGGGIYGISTLGGEERKVVSGGRRPKISPDGKWIAYWVGSEAGDAMSSFLTPGSARIYIAPLAGGSAHQLRIRICRGGIPDLDA
jgi:DNA-binding winged helix-turn-helix (wHTH) protein